MIKSQFGKFVLNDSSSIVLECETEGSPQPVISWLKNDEHIVNNGHLNDLLEKTTKYEFNSEKGELKINELTSLDDGLYVCYASSLDKFPIASLNYTVKGLKKLFQKKNKSIIKIY